MSNYKAKIINIEAIIYDGKNREKVEKFLNTKCTEYKYAEEVNEYFTYLQYNQETIYPTNAICKDKRTNDIFIMDLMTFTRIFEPN